MSRYSVTVVLLCLGAAIVAAVPLPANCYGTQFAEGARAVVPAPDGGWYLAGHTTAPAGAPDSNVVVIRVDSLGVPLWTRTNPARSDFDGREVITSAAPSVDGGVVCTGWTTSYGAFRPPMFAQNSDIFLFQLDPAGNLVWGRTFGRAGDDRAWSVGRTVRDPGFVLAGSSDSGSARYITVIKTDLLGNRQWQRRYFFNTLRQEGLSVVETQDLTFRYAICGRANINGPNNYDAWLMALDSLGNPLWPWGALTIEGAGEDEAWSVIGLPGFVSVAGWSNSFGSGGGPDANILVFHSNMGGTMLNPRVIGWPGFEEKVLGDRALAGEPTLATDFTLAGWTYAKGPGTPAHPNMLILRGQGSSNVLTWSRLHPSVPGELAEQAFAVARTAAGYAVAGHTNSSWSAGAEDIHLVTLDTLGNRPFCTLDSTPAVLPVAGTVDTLYEELLALSDSTFPLIQMSVRQRSICAPVTDVGATVVLAPAGTVDSGTTIVPACSLDNFGPVTTNYSVRCRIGGFYDQIAAVAGHAPGARVELTFPAWLATQVGGPYAVTCSTELAGDPDSTNDKATSSVIVRRPGGRDVGCVFIASPAGVLDSGTAVAPACSVRNFGTGTETYNARLRIGPGYDQSATVTGHAPGTTVSVTFPAWSAEPVGVLAVTCSTELGADDTRANDQATGAVRVQRLGADVGVTAIAAPTGIVLLGQVVAPACTTYNHGNTTAAYDVHLATSTGYAATVAVTGPAPGEARRVTFPAWIAGPAGAVDVTAWTALAGDAVPTNDTARAGCSVVQSGGTGWEEIEPMPLALSGRYAKDGAWLAYNAADARIYAAKGNKTGDFYCYLPGSNTWLMLPLVPEGTEGKMPGKGSAGVADGERYVFCTKGNNTVGFWRFDTDSLAWRQLADVPLGTTNKKVKGGTDLAYVDDGSSRCVYLLKGYKNEFWRYDVAADTWLPAPMAPGRASVKWDRGSFIAYDGARGIYAHKAKYHELYRFELLAGEWDTLPVLRGMPQFSRVTGRSKKSKDGGTGAWYAGSIFAFKGGNTQEFWRYFTAADSWVELETIPAYGSTGKKKRVKAGADIAAVGGGLFYALKGNKANELWRYSLVTTPTRHETEARSGSQANRGFQATGVRLWLAQNPSRGIAVIRWSGLHEGRSARLAVYDAAGRLVLVRAVGPAASGTVRLDLRFLPSDVYFVRLTSNGRTTDQKLVLRK